MGKNWNHWDDITTYNHITGIIPFQYHETSSKCPLQWDSNGSPASSASFLIEDVEENEEFRKIHGSAGVVEAVTQLEKKDSHPLMIMVNLRLSVFF